MNKSQLLSNNSGPGIGDTMNNSTDVTFKHFRFSNTTYQTVLHLLPVFSPLTNGRGD